MTSTQSLPLSECIRLSADRVAIVTFDLPIWLKATDIIKQANIPVITRLGGFHLLKSYFGSIGNIMQDSGLLEVIQLIYPGSMTANHIMDGGCFDKAIRAHLLIDAAIYRHIMKLAFTEEHGDMRIYMEKVAGGKMGARHTEATKEAVVQAGTAIFQYIYHGPDTTLGEIRYVFSRKAAAGVIKPETLPPTEGAAAQHSLRAYLQTRDWMLLQSMSLNPSDYGWTLGVHGYEQVPTLDPMAPEELLKLTSCNCHGDCSNRHQLQLQEEWGHVHLGLWSL